MKGNETWFRKRFRNAEASPNPHIVIATLSELRASRPPAEYASLYGAFRKAASGTLRTLTTSPKAPSELVWIRDALVALPLWQELEWASHWLTPYVNRINAFRKCSTSIQEKIINGHLEDARSLLDEYVHRTGWSLWAVELRAALLQMSYGTEVQRKWLDELQAKSVNSVPGLLFEVFGDRNDDTYSYDAVYAKCMNSFPRFGSLTPWLVDYLKSRALAHFDNPTTAIPNVLGRDITSSLFDYYEGVIVALAYVNTEDEISEARSSASKLINTLIRAGFQDHRLQKLAIAFDVATLSPEWIRSEPNAALSAIYSGAFNASNTHDPAGIGEELRTCQDEGAAVYDLVGKILKWGVNLRSLDIGSAAALAALRSTSIPTDTRTIPIEIFMLSEFVCVHDITALPTEKAKAVFLTYLKSRGKFVADDELLKPSTWLLEETLPLGGPIHLWLLVQLLESNDFNELDYVVSLLKPKSRYWDRQCAKVTALAFVKQGRLSDALNLMEEWYRKAELYAVEFPGNELFEGCKWADFKNIDPVVVGLVAHREFEARGSANVGYICKMACRSFLLSGTRERIVADFENSTFVRKAQLVEFLRDVWIEQNLSLCHQFETTAEVRVERMSVLQFLLNWEQSRAQEYAEAIKDLTFDQTLQRGLERIDQTRVFVNESAITRWAEKELEQDYERWKRLSESSSGGRAVDEMLRQYALDQINVEILMEFANGKPTAADALLIDLLDRLFKRFLLDPTDGLDTYLSVRIRHGSLRGTILGPLEEQGLLYSGSISSEDAFHARWDDALRLPDAEKLHLISIMQDFSQDVRKTVDEFVEMRIQIQQLDKPEGAFQQVLSPFSAKIIAATLAERPPTFYAFLYSSYFVFWKLVEIGLVSLQSYVDDVVAVEIHNRIERLIVDLRALGARYLPLVTTLTTASTMTKSQCDSVADWFQLPSTVGNEKYQLPDAIDIAEVATKNVHRGFSAEVILMSLPSTQLPLTTSGLAVLMDCLFVIFENYWKHSGFTNVFPPMELFTQYDPTERLLTIECRSALSEHRKTDLLNGELTRLRTKYLGELPVELIRVEGGSGFPKLARLARSVPRDQCSHPFDFGIEDGHWFTRVNVPLYEQEGAFEAYE